MGSMEAPGSSKNTTADPVKKPEATYNLDDFALPHFALSTLNLTVPPDVRTWRELADYVRANLQNLPPLMLERTLKLQADYSRAGPAERTNIPAMTPVIKHVPIGGGKGRGGTLVPATSTKTNLNVPGAAQSQGLAQIAIKPRKEAVPVNVGVAAGVASGVNREAQLQAPRKETIAAKVSAVPGLSREQSTQVSGKEATPAKISGHSGYSRAFPQVSRKEATPTFGAAPGTHRGQSSLVWRRDTTPANLSAAPGTYRGQSSPAWLKETTPANLTGAPGAHPEQPPQFSPKEATPVNLSAAPGAHREHTSQVSRKDATRVNLTAAPGAYREYHSQVLRKEAIQANWSVAPGAHRELKEATQVNWSVAPGAQRENSAQVSRRAAIPVDWSATGRAHREISTQASRQEAIPMNWSASSIQNRQVPSEPQRKEAIPAQVGVAPAFLMFGASEQQAVSSATEATFGQTKVAMSNTVAREAVKEDQSLKSVSVNLNANERAKSSKSASDGHLIEKIEAETEEMTLTPMGELIDISIPLSAQNPPQPFHPAAQEIRHLDSYRKAVENTPLMPALAAIPALTPGNQSGAQPQGFVTGPPFWPQPASHLRLPVMLPVAPPTFSRHSSSTRSESPSVYSRSPSPPKRKALDSTLPKQAGRYYLVHKDGGVDYVWVEGAQRGDPCPPHLNPVG